MAARIIARFAASHLEAKLIDGAHGISAMSCVLTQLANRSA
jgi:hypothetical protein